MTHKHHITAHRAGFPLGTTSITKEEDPESGGVDFDIVKMKAGAREQHRSNKETAFVLLDGKCMTEVDGIEHAVSRGSLFDERPSVVLLPPGETITLTAETQCEWARVGTQNHHGNYTPSLFVPESTSSEERGKGLVQDASLRIVRLVFDRDRKPESNLVIGEVVSLAGRWSSYPPHHHEQPELYHYRFSLPQGYGHAEIGDDVVKVKQCDTVKILGGVDHPQVAAPGYAMWYLWIVRHQPNNPYTGFTYTQEHKWLLDGKDQGWKPKEML